MEIPKYPAFDIRGNLLSVGDAILLPIFSDNTPYITSTAALATAKIDEYDEDRDGYYVTLLVIYENSYHESSGGSIVFIPNGFPVFKMPPL